MLGNNYINHIAFVLDMSGSMKGREDDVVKVYQDQIRYLAKASKDLDQETRVSTYLFNTHVQCIVYDKDVLRLPSIQNLYSPNDCTALIDATIKVIGDLQQTAQLYGDHSFLIYVLTDGINTENPHHAPQLTKLIQSLKDNWTLAAFVPDPVCARSCVQFGFPRDNVATWSTAGAHGIEEVGKKIQDSSASYMQARSTGARGSKNIFNLDVTQLNSKVVKSALKELKPGKDYELIPVRKDCRIDEYLSSWTNKPYRQGSGYYQLMKKETIQPQKEVAVMQKRTGKVYTGPDARGLVGLPSFTIDVAAATHPEYTIFIQSTALNRKLIAGTHVIVMK